MALRAKRNPACLALSFVAFVSFVVQIFLRSQPTPELGIIHQITLIIGANGFPGDNEQLNGPTMKSAAPRRWFGLLWVASFAMLPAVQSHARPVHPFESKLEVTPEEGPLDPLVEKRYTPQFAKCQNHAQITSDIAACFEAEFRRQDARLNQAWKATLARLPTTVHASLLAAQRRWVAERDPFCRNDSDGFAGGTIAPVVYVSCRVELTIRRTIWLENLR